MDEIDSLILCNTIANKLPAIGLVDIRLIIGNKVADFLASLGLSTLGSTEYNATSLPRVAKGIARLDQLELPSFRISRRKLCMTPITSIHHVPRWTPNLKISSTTPPRKTWRKRYDVAAMVQLGSWVFLAMVALVLFDGICWVCGLRMVSGLIWFSAIGFEVLDFPNSQLFFPSADTTPPRKTWRKRYDVAAMVQLGSWPREKTWSQWALFSGLATDRAHLF
ncbi:hypothetical protein DH2020_024465 [Rehmannia glutinosa]|uniref:Uncharacterized protein n=1 Tax=Rehmannia glutinosa TaxID=99300 RepID=A0ABR0W6I6_REHGL